MRQHDTSDSAVVLVAHGNSVDPDAGAPVYQHAAALRRHGKFAAVVEAFWKQEPRLLDVLTTLAFPRIFVVPVFASEGYFSERTIPESLGLAAGEGPGRNRVQVRSGQTLFYCRVVGTHPGVKEVVLHRASEVVAKFPFPRGPMPSEISLFVAGHGTERDENSRQVIERLVEELRKNSPYASVSSVYLEEAPRITQCYELAATSHIVVVPFFMGDGPHVKTDLPLQLGESAHVLEKRIKNGQSPWRNPTEKYGKLVWYSQPIGTDSRMVEIVLGRVWEAMAWKAPEIRNRKQEI